LLWVWLQVGLRRQIFWIWDRVKYTTRPDDFLIVRSGRKKRDNTVAHSAIQDKKDLFRGSDFTFLI